MEKDMVENLLEVGKYYRVQNDNGFYMIGIACETHNPHQCYDNSFRGNATFINPAHYEYNHNSLWCFKDKTRIFKFATLKEKYWLDQCIKAGKFIYESRIKYPKDIDLLILNYSIF